MRYIITCVFSLLFFLTTSAQNMVLNPSFEDYIQCPTATSQLTPQYVPYWSWATSSGSADYFNVCSGNVNTHVPNNSWGYQAPYSGNAYAGGYAYSYNHPGSYVEYPKGKLIPLTPGEVYEVTIHVSLVEISKYAVSGLGVFFYKDGIGVPTNLFTLSVIPQVSYSSYGYITDKVNWVTLVDTFVADSAYENIVIGNFYHTPIVVDPASTWFGAYYWYDSIIVRPINLTAVIDSTNIVCNGLTGTATVIANGGFPPYTYLWSNGQTTATISGLSAGTYTCTITDAANQSITQTVNITQPPALTAGVSSLTHVSCYGESTGSVSVTVSGGTPPYTYQWQPGGSGTSISGVPAGTYTFTVTDANNCTATATATVTQPQMLLIGGTQTNVTCFGLSNGTANVVVTGGAQPYTYLWDNGQTTPAVTGLASGAHYVVVVDNNGCSTMGVVFISQPPVLNMVTSAMSATACTQNTGSATVTTSGGTPPYAYSWSPYGGTSNSAGNLGAGVYVVTVTDSKGCTDTVHITINTATPPTITISPITQVSCYGGSNGSATASASNGVSPYTYLWSNGQTSATATGLTAGTYTVTATGANGCAGSSTVTINQPPQLVVNISATTNVNCFGQSNGSANATVSGGTPAYTYQWLPTGGTNANASNLSAGTYTLNVTDSKGCTGSSTVTITQPPILNATITSANATCSQSNGWATVSPTGGTTPYTYLWSNGQTGATINNLNGGNYSVTVTDANGCTSTAAVTITQSSALNVLIAANNINCNGLNNGSATASVSTGTPPYIYQWSSGQATASIGSLSAGTYTVTVTDLVNCVGTATVTITEPPVLTGTISSGADVLCHGESTGEATVTASGGTAPYSYQWSNGGTTATISNFTAGTYTVTVTDSNGCTVIDSVTINEPSELSLSVTAKTKACKNEMNGSATIAASGGVTPYTYQWDNGATGTTVSNLASGSYDVTVTDANGCTKTIQVTIGEHPETVVTAGDDKVYCEGKEAVTLHGSGADSYEWSPAGGLSCTACATTEATPGNTTVYVLTGTDANGCKATDEVEVTVQIKEPTATGADIHICGAQTVRLEAMGGEAYNWEPAEGMDDSYTARPTVTVQESTDYTVIIRQNECFTDTLAQRVIVHTKPEVSIGPDINAGLREQVQLHADTSNATSIEWIPPVNLSCADCDNPIANAERDIRYVARVSNEGCVAEDDLWIRVDCTEGNIWLPNSFTPNNDGKNEYFYPRGVPLQAVSYMAVYNRWGQKIFERERFTANDPGLGWDGTFKGKRADLGVYHYYLKFQCGNGKAISLKGDITLLR